MEETKSLQKGNPLGYQPIGKLLATFSVPAIIACLVNSIYNIVDQIFIGQGVGYLGNAATTVAFPIVMIVMAFATLIGSGGSAFAAIKMGESKEDEAEKSLNNVFTLTMIFGIVIMILSIMFLEPILRLFGTTDRVMPYAKDYTFILLLGVPFSMLGVSLSNMARTDGNPRLSMYGILIGAVLNTILDPIYIFVFHWGVKGAAIATITSQILSAIILMVYFCKHGKMRLKLPLMRLHPRICGGVLSLGISSGVTMLVGSLMQVAMNNSLVYYGNQSSVGGDVALSAMGIVTKIAMILGSVCIGIGVGSQPILGFNYGAGQHKRVKNTFVMASVVSTIAIALGWLVCQLIPHLIISIFGDGNAEFNVFAVKCLRIFLGGIFCAGFQIVSTSYFQATGQPLKASILSMLRQLLILIPLILILPLFYGLDGVLYAGPIADISSAVIVFAFVAVEMKKLNKKIAQDESDSLTLSTNKKILTEQ